MIPFGVILSHRPTFPFKLRLLLYYISTDVLLVALDTIARRHFHNNVPIFHLSTLFDITFIVFTYNRILTIRNKNIIPIIWIVFIFVWLISGLTIDYYLTNLNTVSKVFGNCIVVTLSIVHIMHTFSDRTNNKYREAYLTFSILVFIYYSCSIPTILLQDLYRYEMFKGIFLPIKNSTTILTTIPYPFVRAIQSALLVRILLLLPTHITPRNALPKWLRFRVGWRPPTEPPQYRVLPAHLVG